MFVKIKQLGVPLINRIVTKTQLRKIARNTVTSAQVPHAKTKGIIVPKWVALNAMTDTLRNNARSLVDCAQVSNNKSHCHFMLFVGSYIVHMY